MATALPRRRRSILLLSLIGAALIVAAVVWAVVASMSREEGEAAGAPESALPAQTSMGVVELNVHDLATMRAYYEGAIGLDVIDDIPDSITLGASGTPLIRLVAKPLDEPAAAGTDPGLYHSAILYPNEPALAQTIAQVAAVAPETFQGASDHAVSVAFYFADPEGNGVELYVDRPEAEWVWENGAVQMGSAPVDIDAFMQRNLGADAGTSAALMGHVHLKVGNLEDAERFYADTLGFAVTSRANGAIFYSAGGYHHHLATNVWQSAGAAQRSTTMGLGSFAVSLPDDAALTDVVSRLDDAGVDHTEIPNGIALLDPWGNTVRLIIAADA